MPTLYITEPHAYVSKDGDALTVKIPADAARKTESRKQTIPLIKIDQVVVFGDATITSPALAALLAQHSEICYLSAYGQWRGRLSPELSKNSLLRIEQHKAHHDAWRRFSLARGFVWGKLANMRTLMMRGNRKRNVAAVDAAAQRMKGILAQIESLPNQAAPPAGGNDMVGAGGADASPRQSFAAPPDPARPQENSTEGVLMGLEGAGSAAYFEVFEHLLGSDSKGEAWAFAKRIRRPPTDPVNALLSYAYTLLHHQVSAAVNIVGLDPYVGFLHSSQYGKPAMALDVMEEFRPVVADSVVLTVLNNGMVSHDDFEEEMGAVRLNERGRRTFLTKFEERLNSEITHPVFNNKVSYRRCLEMQVRLVGKVLLGEIPTYVPFCVR